MSITIDAIYENGVLRLDQPLTQLKERTKVHLTIEAADESPESTNVPLATILERMERRREAIYQRCGELGDSVELIREGREKELA